MAGCSKDKGVEGIPRVGVALRLVVPWLDLPGNRHGEGVVRAKPLRRLVRGGFERRARHPIAGASRIARHKSRWIEEEMTSPSGGLRSWR